MNARSRGIVRASVACAPRRLTLVLSVAVLAMLLVCVFAATASAAGAPAIHGYSGFHPQTKAATQTGVETKFKPSPLRSKLRSHTVTAAAAPGTGSISGKVTTSGGTGLAGVEVDFLDKDLNLLDYANTDSKGAYTISGLPNAPVAVCTSNDLNYLDEWYDNVPAFWNYDATGATWLDLGATAARTNINFALSPGLTLSGKVTNSSGTGLAHVRVDAYTPDGMGNGEAETTSTGTYSIKGLPPGQYYVQTSNMNGYVDEWYNNVVYATHPDAEGATLVNVASANVTGINFSLALGRTISGYVTAPDSPTAMVDGVDAFTLSGELVQSGYPLGTGAYHITGLPAGKYLIKTSSEGLVDEWYDNDVWLLDPTGINATVVDVTTANATGKDFDLGLGLHIAGTVKDSKGNPLPDCEVDVQAVDGYSMFYAYTDDTGSYFVSGLVAGQYLVNTGNQQGYVDEWYDNDPAPTDLMGGKATPVVLSTASRDDIDFALDKGFTISGSTTYEGIPGGFGDPELSVDLYNGAGELCGRAFSYSSSGGSDLEYVTSALPPGTYYVKAEDFADSYVPLPGDPVIRATADYAAQWYDGFPASQYDLASATPVNVTNADVTGIDFNIKLLQSYEQTDPHVAYAGTWNTVSAASAHGGSFAQTNTSGSSLTVKFKGIRLDWMATVGATMGKADVYLDGVKDLTVDLSTPMTIYKQKVYSTGDLTRGLHTVQIVWDSANATGSKYIDIDGLMVDGVAVYDPPVVTGISPSTGSVLGDDAVTITGTGLGDATAVTFDGIPATNITVDSLNQITVLSPAHSAGSAPIQVTTPAGTSPESAADDFTYVPAVAPTITGLSPTSGTMAGGTSVVITGTSFTGATTVTFDGLPAATFTVDSSTKITAVTPAHAAGAAPVQVTTSKGPNPETAADDFTYTAAPPTIRYDQTNTNIVKTGTWGVYAAAGAYDGNYGRSATSGASATIWFIGAQLDWIAMKGTTTGKADVYLDGVKQATIDLSAVTPSYQQVVWSTGLIPNGLHVVKIVRSSANVAGKYVTLDAVDIAGIISAPRTRYEQTNTKIVKTGSWSNFSASHASGGSYGRSSTSAASATVHFTGTSIDWIGTKGTTTGFVDVYLDGVKQTTVDLTAGSVSYQLLLWSSGVIADGSHTLQIVRNDALSGAGKYVTLDAFDVWGTVQ